MVEEARLESVYTSKAYRGFESPLLRKKAVASFLQRLFCKRNWFVAVVENGSVDN